MKPNGCHPVEKVTVDMVFNVRDWFYGLSELLNRFSMGRAKYWHRYGALLVSVVLIPIALSGALLSSRVVVEQISEYGQELSGKNLSDVLLQVEEKYPGIEYLERSQSNALILHYRENNRITKVFIDVNSGEVLGSYKSSEFYSWLQSFHRSFFIGSAGRFVVGLCAFILVILTVTGVVLTARRQGGYRYFFGKPKGRGIGKLHVSLGQITLLPLLLLSTTGVYLSLISFHLLPDGSAQSPVYPESREALVPVTASSFSEFSTLPMSKFQSISFPIVEDWFDVYTVKTKQSYQFYDQFTGELLSQQAYSRDKVLYGWIMKLHSGEGLVWLAIPLGLSASAIPVFALTGLLLWWLQRSRRSKSKEFSANEAEAIILVGSETNTTWTFANRLTHALKTLGYSVHLNELNAISHFPRAKYVFALTSTFGDGHAPGNADQFVSRLQCLPDELNWRFSVLGFGDTSFDKFCHFADSVAQHLSLKAKPLLPSVNVDRQCQNTFQRWGLMLGDALNRDIVLPLPEKNTHKDSLVKFTLLERQDHSCQGHETCVLDFSTANLPGDMNFEPGDLLAVKVEGTNDTRLRYYSIASHSASGVLNIAVKRSSNGLCSSQLYSLVIGHSISGRIQKNPHFYFPSNNVPVVFIAAGTGIAPLFGMIEACKSGLPIDLYFGCRHPDADFLYKEKISELLESKQLSNLYSAYSRVSPSFYVQDRLAEQADAVVQRINEGAVFRVCGGTDMAKAVQSVLSNILEQHREQLNHLTLEHLKQSNRYIEEVY